MTGSVDSTEHWNDEAVSVETGRYISVDTF